MAFIIWWIAVCSSSGGGRGTSSSTDRFIWRIMQGPLMHYPLTDLIYRVAQKK